MRDSSSWRIREAATGEHRWFQTRATPVRDEEDRIVEWLGTSTDVQDMREMQERQGVLVAELQHRTKNVMAVVRGVMEKTRQQSRDLATFAASFDDRLRALACGRAQGYHFARPMPAGAVTELLDRESTVPLSA